MGESRPVSQSDVMKIRSCETESGKWGSRGQDRLGDPSNRFFRGFRTQRRKWVGPR